MPSARVFGLALTSQKIFNAIGIWDALDNRAIPIKKIHVSAQGHFGSVKFNAEQEGVPSVGHVVRESDLLHVLHGELLKEERVTLFDESTLESIVSHSDSTELTVKRNHEVISIRAKLVIAADGTHSTVRRLLSWPVETFDYQQHAVVCEVAHEKSNEYTAYERFTPSGPLALLPLSEHNSAVVLTVAKHETQYVLDLDDEHFSNLLHDKIGLRLGKFSNVSERKSYPLSMVYSKKQAEKGVIMVGNAAHTLHPIAAQGLNLGLRDVAMLAEIISDACSKHMPLRDAELCKYYEKKRKQDHDRVMTMTDSLVHLFSKKFMPYTFGRSLGFVAFDLISSVKHLFSKITMGRFGPLPKLACGVPLNE